LETIATQRIKSDSINNNADWVTVRGLSVAENHTASLPNNISEEVTPKNNIWINTRPSAEFEGKYRCLQPDQYFLKSISTKRSSCPVIKAYSRTATATP
jgi:hypothetical protein